MNSCSRNVRLRVQLVSTFEFFLVAGSHFSCVLLILLQARVDLSGGGVPFSGVYVVTCAPTILTVQSSC
jgi:hypothetical protein